MQMAGGDGLAGSLGIVADDLTGAFDTAGVFAPAGMTAYVSLSLNPQPPRPSPGVLCIDTRTRNGAAGDAARRVREATRNLRTAGCSRLYKKIDSTLRGHVAAETAAMLDASGATCAFAAPAFPATGRTQRHGVLYVGGVTLAEATEGSDPMGNAPTSSVVELLTNRTGLRCGLVPLSEVEAGEAAIAARTGSLLAKGCSVVAFDAVTTGHMRRIEAVLSRSFPSGLLVGSAGLASALADRVGRSYETPVRPPPPMRGPVLVVSGSLNPVSLRQVERLTAELSVHSVSIDAGALLDSPEGPGAELHRVRLGLVAALGRGQDPCLTWAGTPPTGPSTAHREQGRRLNAALSRLMHGIGHGAPAIGGLVLVGGDTAEAVLTGLGAQGIAMRSEVMPGISAGTVAGGHADSKPVIAKAGGFGDDNALLRAVAYLRGKS